MNLIGVCFCGRRLLYLLCQLKLYPVLLMSFYFAIQLIVEAVRNQNYRGDIAIDEIGFNKGLCGKQTQSGPETRAS